MAAFPALSSGVVAKYPVTRTRTFRSQVYCHVDMSEQRFSKGEALEAFTLVFTKVKTADKEIVRTFFNDRKGAFDTTWTLTLNDPLGSPTTWLGLQFVPGQAFEATESIRGIWDFQVQVRQTRLI